MHTIVFSMDPESTILIIADDYPEGDLQDLRDKFPHHKIVSCCRNHAPGNGAFMAPAAMLDNAPPCAIVLTPDDEWKLPL